jgi:hypothetical protein
MGFIRRNGAVVYDGPHVGSRGSLESIKNGGGEDFSEISEEDQMWEESVRSAFITREASFRMGDFDSDDYEFELIKNIYGEDYSSLGTFREGGLFRPLYH